MKMEIKGKISDYPIVGVSYDQAVEGPMQNSYLRLKKDPSTDSFHQVLKDLEDAYRIINTIYRVKTVPDTDFQAGYTYSDLSRPAHGRCLSRNPEQI